MKIKPDPVADELNLALCTLHHMRSPSCMGSVWSACQGLQWGGVVHRKQISFLDLGPSFLFHPSPPPPPSTRPFIWPLQGETARLSRPPLWGIFNIKKLISAWRGKWGLWVEVYRWGQLDLDVVEMIASRENARFMMHGNYKLEKQEGVKKKLGLRVIFFCSWAKVKRAQERVNLRW